MTNLTLTQTPVMKTGMLIRKPASDVFEAFVNPAITSKFWFTKGSGRLEAEKQVQWEWEMYSISVPVAVKAVEPNKRILIEWPSPNGPTTVEWTFTPHELGTFVGIANAGFSGDGDAVVRQVTDSTQGFSLLLAGAKAYLEHGIQLNLVADRYPKGVSHS
ncbi:MAG: SRPBCC family protein [Gemmataceae bacterium]